MNYRISNRIVYRFSAFLFWSFLFLLSELMAQNYFPAVDEFSGMYNARSVFETEAIEGIQDPNEGVLYSVEEAKTPPTIEEIKSIGDAVSAYEKRFVDRLLAGGNLLVNYRKGTYFVPGDRTVHMLPGDYSLVNEKFCEGLSVLLQERFPLWRVMVCVHGTKALPIVYPARLVIPKSWQGREDEYWRFIEKTGEQAFETAPARMEELEAKIATSVIERENSEEVSGKGLEVRFLGIFEKRSLNRDEGQNRLNLWIETDNKYPGKTYRPKGRVVEGFCGSESVFGVDSQGEIRKHDFGNLSKDDEGFSRRIYVFSYQADMFDGKIHLRSPESGENFELIVPEGVTRWRQVEGRQEFERVSE